ncbi:rhombosortase [Pseudochryseolinea flava]|uniref:Rhombosortase n=2 Tax=Pseudochryseolinea flava TaxID=2059302 RepID=A0A364XX54_9BACT|nr:rhombosortase [Pseudochryseolinea flava]
MWAVFYLEILLGFPFKYFGIVPRTPVGLIGIFSAPLLHGNLIHLISNTIPMLFLGSVLFFFYPGVGGRVFLRAYFWTNVLVWIFARPATNHIGASGVVFAIAFFLIFFGFFRRDFVSIFISVIVIILYGGVFFQVIPNDPSISAESHLAGALVGTISAINFANKKNIY